MYYISELHMGNVPGDGYELIDSTDMFGPYKSLSKSIYVAFNKSSTTTTLSHFVLMPNRFPDNNPHLPLSIKSNI